MKNNDYYIEKIEKIMQTIEENENLSTFEKEEMLILEEMLCENSEYIDLEYVQDVFKNLKTSYKTYEEGLVCGSSAIFNKIVDENSNLEVKLEFFGGMFDGEKEDFSSFENTPKTTFYHELFHTLEGSYELSNMSNNNLLVEVLNEIYVKEYGNVEPNGYDCFIPLGYMLLELLDIKTIKKFKFSNNYNVIVEELLDIHPSIDLAYEFLNALLKSQIFLNLLESETEEEFNNISDILRENQQVVYCLYKFYYEKKYNHLLETNTEMMFTLYETIYENFLSLNAINKETNLNIEDEFLLDKVTFDNRVHIKFDNEISLRSVKGYISNEHMKYYKKTAFHINSDEYYDEYIFTNDTNEVNTNIKRKKI